MKVVIVGGGVIGLLSALVLAQAGCQVTILEKNSMINQYLGLRNLKTIFILLFTTTQIMLIIYHFITIKTVIIQMK